MSKFKFKSDINEHVYEEFEIGDKVFKNVKVKELNNNLFNRGELDAFELLTLLLRENDQETIDEILDAINTYIKPTDNWKVVNLILEDLEGNVK